MTHIQVDGLRVELRRKPIQSIRLHIDPSGLVWVSLPPHCPAERAADLVRSHRQMVDRALVRAKQPPTFWGDPLPDGFQGLSLERLYQAETARATAELASSWEPVIGKAASRWSLRWMKTRWGSCQPATGRITINWALAALPLEFLEEVVVHELVHLEISGHGPTFYARMSNLLPTWPHIRSRMRAVRPFRPTV
ncbi:MAG: M48 family metallopeptidase [Bifidobacteriaceae bacterium]|nr:M48 family metallopeptidase [Bifidobacteriaceae bacterium]